MKVCDLSLIAQGYHFWLNCREACKLGCELFASADRLRNQTIHLFQLRPPQNNAKVILAPSPIRVLLAGIAALILTVGLSRFAYTPLLPKMLVETALTKAQGSWLATFNYLGYLSGAMLVAAISQAHLKWQFYRICLLLSLLSTLAMGFTEQFWLWAVLRFVGGIASVAGLLLASAFVLNWLSQQQRRPQLGLHFVGMGAGIALVGLLAGSLSFWLNWADFWRLFAALGIGFFWVAWNWMPQPHMHQTTNEQPSLTLLNRHWLRLMLAAYFCAGFAFVVCTTFIVVELERLPKFQQHGAWIWLGVGVVATPAALCWDWLAKHQGLLPAIALAYALQMLGILLPLVSHQPWVHLFGALCFGFTFIGIVSLMLTLAGRRFASRVSTAMGQLTISYGFAQIVAPFLAGFVVQRTGNFQLMMWLACGVLLVGLVLISLLMRVERQQRVVPD